MKTIFRGSAFASRNSDWLSSGAGVHARIRARAVRTLLVIEEKRSFLEFQLRDLLIPADANGRRSSARSTPRANRCCLRPANWIRTSLRAFWDASSQLLRRQARRLGKVGRDPSSAKATLAGFALPRSVPAVRTTVPRCCSTVRWRAAVSAAPRCPSNFRRINRGFEFMTQMGSEGAPLDRHLAVRRIASTSSKTSATARSFTRDRSPWRLASRRA